MRLSISSRRFPWRWLPGIVLFGLVAGCGEPPQVEEYTVPKSPRAEQPNFQHPPMSAQARPQAAPSGPSKAPSYEVPAEWKQVPNSNELTLATFQVSPDDKETLVTIIAMPALPEAMILPNVNLWRKQVYLAPLGADAPLDFLQELPSADGTTGRYLKLVNENADTPQAMLMLFTQHAGQTWYFKLMGNAELVLQEEPRFKTFVQSVRFSPKKVAGDE